MDSAEFREAAHRVVDLLADYFDRIGEVPVFPRVEPETVDQLFAEPLPRDGEPAGAVLDELERKLLPYCTHVGHPGYFGLITPSPTPMGAVGDFIAAALNQNLGQFSIGPSAVAMERRTVRWLTDLAGYGSEAGGNLTSGGTMANFIGLKLARDAVSGDVAQHAGLREPWAVYASEERHVSVDKAVDAVGVGRDALRVLPTDDAFRLRLDALEDAIAADKAAGVRPLCIVAIAGTTNTGAIDPLRDLRRVADREGMWLHADAAYGGGMLLSRRWPGLLADLPLSDSITFDPHKWFYAPLDAGALLVRDASRLLASFGMVPPYLADELETGPRRYHYYVHGFEQSRRFRALKIWMSFKRYGSAQIGAWIDANVEQARRLHALVDADPDFEAAMAPPMSAICVRYAPAGVDENSLADLHHRVAHRVEAGGRFWISTTLLKGRWWFRINPVNFRTTLRHIDELFALLRGECREALTPAGCRSGPGTPAGSPPARS